MRLIGGFRQASHWPTLRPRGLQSTWALFRTNGRVGPESLWMKGAIKRRSGGTEASVPGLTPKKQRHEAGQTTSAPH